MHRILTVLIICLPAVTAAQTLFCIKGGLNIADIVMTNYINPDVEGDLDIKFGLDGGVFIKGTMKERVTLTAELLYSNRGVRGGGTNINLHYIALPVLLQYGLTNKIVAEIGPELGYLVSARSKHGNVSNTYNNKFDVALDAGFQLDASRMIFGLRYCVGLFSVREPMETMGPSGRELIKYQNRVLQLSVGYKLWTLE